MLKPAYFFGYGGVVSRLSSRVINACTAPILNEVYAILYEKKKPADALHALMTRELKRETASPFPKKE